MRLIVCAFLQEEIKISLAWADCNNLYPFFILFLWLQLVISTSASAASIFAQLMVCPNFTMPYFVSVIVKIDVDIV